MIEKDEILIIKTDGETTLLTEEEFIEGKGVLKALQDAVGGYITTVATEDPSKLIVVDDEGLIKQRLPNIKASDLTGQCLVGTAVLCNAPLLDRED